MSTRIVLGDITTFAGDALLNAANPQMLGGGGVDGAVHRAAGPGGMLKLRCSTLPGVQVPYTKGTPDEPEGSTLNPHCVIRCPVGHVRPVPATHTGLKVGWVINTAGPILSPQRAGALRVGEVVVPDEAAASGSLLALYARALEMVRLLGLKSLAVPAVSTGVYGVPHAVCAEAFMCALYSQRKRSALAKAFGEWFSGYEVDVDVTVYLHGPGLAKGDLAAWYRAAESFGIELGD